MEEKRKRRLRRVALAVVSLLAVTLVGGVVGLRLYYNDTRLLALVRALVAKNVPFPVSIGGVELRLRHGIVVRDVVVGPPNAAYHAEVFSVHEVRLGYRLGPLLHKRLVVDDVEVVAPHATLEMQDGKWNVVALGEAFASPAATQSASAPAKPEASGELPLAIDVEKIAVTEANVDIDSADLGAHLEHVTVTASAALAGKEGHGKIKLVVGTAAVPSRLRFRQRGLGEAEASLITQLDVDAPSLNAAKVALSLQVNALSGKLAGFALPDAPIALQLHANVNLLQQLAQLEDFSLRVGEAVSVEAKASVTQMLGDNPAVALQSLSVKAALAPLLALAPRGLVPVAAHGNVEALVSANGTKNAFVARRDFVAHASVTWRHVHAVSGPAVVNDVNGALEIDLGGKELSLKLTGDVANAQAAPASASGVKWRVNVQAPWSVLSAKLDAPIKTALVLSVDKAQVTGQEADDTEVDVSAELLDLAAAHARARVKVSTQANVVAGAGVIHLPVSVALSAERRAPRATLESLQVVLGDALTASAHGEVEQKPGGALAVDVEAKIDEANLAALWRILPDGLEPPNMMLAGEVSVQSEIVGTIDKTLKARLTGTPLQLLARVSPLRVNTTLTGKNIALHMPGTVADNVRGTLGIALRPEAAEVKLSGDVDALSAAGADVRGVHFSLAMNDAAGKVRAAFDARVASLHKPDVLALDLENTTLGARLSFARDAELEAFDLSVPSVGAQVHATARLLQADKLVRDQGWRDLRGVVAETSAQLSLRAPKKIAPLAGSPLVLSGEVATRFAGKLEDELIQLSGALEAKDFCADSGGAVLAHMSGGLPFAQDLKLVHGAVQPVWSSDDIFKRKPRLSYYDALRSYGRDAAGLSIAHLQVGRITLDKIVLDGRYAQGVFAIDHFGAHALDGDASGQLAVQLGADKTFRASLQTTFANIDLSVLSKTAPGPDSQINGDMSVGLQWGERIHDLNGTVNFTKLGRTMLEKGLLALDPEGKDEKMKKNRQMLERYQITIDLVQVAIRNNVLTLNLLYSLLLTKLTLGLYKPLQNDLVPRKDQYSVRPYLDQYLKPALDPALGRLFGWRTSPGEGSEE